MSVLTRLLIATRNEGKVEEYEELLADLPLALTFLTREGIAAEVEETGSTFKENAVQKAEEYVRLSGLLTLADDSGLEVDALGGEPGVFSARYAGPGATDEDRYRLLLDKMQEIPWEQRTARFRCVVAVAEPGGVGSRRRVSVRGLSLSRLRAATALATIRSSSCRSSGRLWLNFRRR